MAERCIVALLLALAALGAPARAAEGDAALEARVMEVAGELRCVVCQNETLAASQSDLARDLRGLIARQLAEGHSPQQVREHLVARYGDFILYRPPVQPNTLALWAGPAVLLALALAALGRRLRRGAAKEPR